MKISGSPLASALSAMYSAWPRGEHPVGIEPALLDPKRRPSVAMEA